MLQVTEVKRYEEILRKRGQVIRTEESKEGVLVCEEWNVKSGNCTWRMTIGIGS